MWSLVNRRVAMMPRRTWLGPMLLLGRNARHESVLFSFVSTFGANQAEKSKPGEAECKALCVLWKSAVPPILIVIHLDLQGLCQFLKHISVPSCIWA